MAIRTTSAAVAAIIEVDANIPLDPFIETASALVDRVESEDEDGELSASVLELIERWLSAHFYAVRDPRATSERAGPVGASYESKVDLGLNITRYGQQALALDSTGILADLTSKKRKRASLHWLGNEEDRGAVSEE